MCFSVLTIFWLHWSVLTICWLHWSTSFAKVAQESTLPGTDKACSIGGGSAMEYSHIRELLKGCARGVRRVGWSQGVLRGRDSAPQAARPPKRFFGAPPWLGTLSICMLKILSIHMLSELNMIIWLYKMKSAAHSVKLEIHMQLIYNFALLRTMRLNMNIYGNHFCWKWNQNIHRHTFWTVCYPYPELKIGPKHTQKVVEDDIHD
jgi:hypothetical protein